MLCAQPASVSCFVAILTECCSPTVPPQRPVSLLWNWWKRSLMAGVQDGDKVLELLFVLLLFFLPLPLFLHIAAFSAVCHLLISHSLSHSHKLAHSSFFFCLVLVFKPSGRLSTWGVQHSLRLDQGRMIRHIFVEGRGVRTKNFALRVSCRKQQQPSHHCSSYPLLEPGWPPAKINEHLLLLFL